MCLTFPHRTLILLLPMPEELGREGQLRSAAGKPSYWTSRASFAIACTAWNAFGVGSLSTRFHNTVTYFVREGHESVKADLSLGVGSCRGGVLLTSY
jgi:hypothetical protein